MTLLRVEHLNEHIITAKKIILAFLLVLGVYSFSFSPTPHGFVDGWRDAVLADYWELFAPIIAQVGIQAAYLALALFMIYLISGRGRRRTLFSLQLAFTCYAVGYVWIHYSAYGMMYQAHFLHDIPWAGAGLKSAYFGQDLSPFLLVNISLYLFVYFGSGILSLIVVIRYTTKRFDRTEFVKIILLFVIQAFCYMMTPGFYLWRFLTW